MGEVLFMQLQQFYEEVGGNYDEVMARLRKEDRIVKYLGLFLADESYTQLCAAVDAQDWEQSFRASHNLKGVAANLGLGSLFEASSTLCESVRHGAPTGDMAAMIADVRTQYAATEAAIKALQADASGE